MADCCQSKAIGLAMPARFHVPDARCERTVRHEVALCLGQTTVESIRFQALNAAYQNPPLIVSNRANGSRRSWQLLRENVPLSALTIRDGQALARFYNPLQSELTLNHAYMASDVWGSPLGEADQIRAKQIMTVQIESDVVPSRTIGDDSALFAAELPAWRVGINKGQPDRAILAELAVRVDEMGSKLHYWSRNRPKRPAMICFDCKTPHLCLARTAGVSTVATAQSTQSSNRPEPHRLLTCSSARPLKSPS